MITKQKTFFVVVFRGVKYPPKDFDLNTQTRRNKMSNITIKKEVDNVSVELLGNRIIITSNDDNRTELHFDNNGNQLHI